MKRTIKAAIAGLLMIPVIGLGSIAIMPTSAFAGDCTTDPNSISGGIDCANPNATKQCLFTSATCTNGFFTKIINTALFIIGALSVLMLIYGGIRYTISAGDSKHVEAAKNTIMYAIIGIVVAVLAYAIVNFVITRLG
jgi:hypothetical protein